MTQANFQAALALHAEILALEAKRTQVLKDVAGLTKRAAAQQATLDEKRAELAKFEAAVSAPAPTEAPAAPAAPGEPAAAGKGKGKETKAA